MRALIFLQIDGLDGHDMERDVHARIVDEHVHLIFKTVARDGTQHGHLIQRKPAQAGLRIGQPMAVQQRKKHRSQAVA